MLKQNDTIGKKGVGFKTIFAIASEVQIHSGDYHFRLKDHSPTIPDLLRGYEGKRENGTKMVITTKGERGGAVLDRSSMLQMCLCLRRLRSISIDSHEMTITDTETERKIKLDGTEYRFRRYELPFTANQEALQEIRERTNHVSEQQRITCYVPIDKKESEYPLYVGLPTTHRIRIPVVIDAPFELTTSREQINTDFRRWNVLVRRKVYEAVLQMMLHRRNEDGERIFRFVRILARREGTAQVYKNVFSDCEFLNQHPILSDLKQAEILPTFAAGTYARPDGRSALVYPPVANFLFQEGSFGSVLPQQAIRVVSKDYVSVLNALMCRNAAPKKVLTLLERYSRTWIAQEEYRSLLYEYLQGISQEFQARLQKMPIIPVYGRSEGKTVFISWERNTIFVKKNAKISNADYFVLNESFLPKASCERFLGVNINEVTRDWERSRYNDNLVELLRGRDVERIYEALLREYQSGRLEQNGSWGVLLEHRERVPLKNLMDDIVDTDLFWSNLKEDYFQVEMLLSLIVHPECRELAQKLRYEELKYIRYENLEIDEALTEDDVEALTDSYFQYSDELLHGCYRDGYLSRDLLEEHNLQYIGVTVSEGEMEHYTFPGEPVLNPKRLKIFIENQMRDRGKIVSVKCTRMVQKIQNKNGKTYDIPERETRDKTMERYEPEGRRDLCFCQMCKKVKSKAKIEVNRLEPEPLLYFHQMHVALCLECSVDFKAFRQNPEIEQRFLSTIRSESTANRPMIAVQLYKDRTITFTGTHLAEIQEILRQRPRG